MSDSFHRFPALSKQALKGKWEKMKVTWEIANGEKRHCLNASQTPYSEKANKKSYTRFPTTTIYSKNI